MANKPPPWHNEIIPSSYIDLQHYPMPPQDGAIGIPLLSPTINRHRNSFQDIEASTPRTGAVGDTTPGTTRLSPIGCEFLN